MTDWRDAIEDFKKTLKTAYYSKDDPDRSYLDMDYYMVAVKLVSDEAVKDRSELINYVKMPDDRKEAYDKVVHHVLDMLVEYIPRYLEESAIKIE